MKEQFKGFYNTPSLFNNTFYGLELFDIEDIDIAFGKNNAFQMKAIVSIQRPNQEDPKRYELVAQGKLITVKANYPKNPWGYMITGYREVTKKELN